MPRRALSLEEKHRRAILRRDKILENYNGDRLFIIMEGQRYKRNKEPSLKQVYNDYKHLLMLEKKINDLEETMIQQEQQHGAPSHPPQDHQATQCHNCKRVQSLELLRISAALYELHFHTVQSDVIEKHRTFKFLNIPTDRIVRVDLCTECFNHLTASTAKEAKNPQYTWPGFIWGFLISQELREKYEFDELWKFIPTTWRYWWADYVQETIFTNATINYPKPYFVDRSFELDDWKELIATASLPKLRDACNKYLIPQVSG